MTKNVGNLDRAIRIIVGFLILGLGFFYESWWGVIGIIPIITGAMGWCPAYIPFKINTNK